MNGWVSFHRKITEWGWYKHDTTFRLFFHLVTMANSAPGVWQGQPTGIGQHITSQDKLCQQLGATRGQIRVALSNLQKTNEITVKTTSRYSLITVVNYAYYQSREGRTTNRTTAKATNEQPTNNQRTTINKKEKKEKKEKKNIKDKDIFLEFVELKKVEYENLVEKFGKNIADDYIERLNNYIGSKGTKYKSHYHTILNWSRKDTPKSKTTNQETTFR